MAEIFGVTDGPLFEEISRNILSLNGEDHRRLRNLVNPAFAPRGRALPPGDARFLEELTGAFSVERRDEAGVQRPHDVVCRVVGDMLQVFQLPG